MTSILPCARWLPVELLAVSVAISVLAGSPARADDEGVSPGFFQQHIWGNGTLSYGGDATYPGFPGFGLSFHAGYGYGGNGLGVGAFGGYPFFGGPGYPHPAPVLRRCGGISPFLFFGGPDYPRYGYSNYFTEIGPLVVRQPVAVVGNGREYGYSGDFGPFTGTLPYPDAYFAPFAEAAAGGSTATPADTFTPAPAPPSANPGAR
jgi:hypothetical protein